MAGNANSGKNAAFLLSERELDKKIEQYKDDLKKGVFGRASWPHFAAYLDSTEEDLKEVIRLGDKGSNAYRGRARALKKMATWIFLKLVI